MEKQISDYHKHKAITIDRATQNTTLIKRLERDISLLQVDVTQIKSDISFIRSYIEWKKEKEEGKWF
tara:strand:+ start:3756 stop:3956 length:201 start_codon:yes stop_codon:yes gene_type:complete